jgi:hypothetical protein
MNERPKSREETPKEGSSTASTMLHCINMSLRRTKIKIPGSRPCESPKI